MGIFSDIGNLLKNTWNSVASRPLDNFNSTFGGICNSLHNTMSNSAVVGTPNNLPYFSLATQNILIALVISLTVLLLIYLINAYRKDQRKIAYVKTEIYEIVLSGIIGFSILAVTYWFCTMPIVNIYPQSSRGSSSIYQVTQEYFSKSETQIKEFNIATYIVGTRLDLESSIAPTAKPLSVGMQSRPFVGLFQPVKQMDYNAFISTIIFLISLYGFQYISSLGAYVSLNFFLPLGVLLRAFSPTRRYGGAVLGLALGFLIILPFMFSMSYEMLYGRDSTTGTKYGLISSFGDVLSGARTTLGSINMSSIKKMFSGVFKDVFTRMKKALKLIYLDTMSGKPGNVIKDIYLIYINYILIIVYMIMGVIWQGMFISLVMPIFSFYIFAEATRYLAGVLGEEINVFGITRLI